MQTSDPLVILRVAALPFERLAALAGGGGEDPASGRFELDERIEGAAARLEQDLFDAAGPPEAIAQARWSEQGSVAAARRVALLQARRHVHHRRAARLAAAAAELGGEWPDLAVRLGELARDLDRRSGLAEGTSIRSFESGARALVEMLGDPLIQEGLRLAGRPLHGKAMRIARVPPEQWTHRDRHAALKVSAYVVRFATKTSPNGVFALTAVARIGDRASCRGDNRVARRAVLLGVGEARKVAACLAVDPTLEAAIIPRVNPTLTEQDGCWELWKAASPRNAQDDEVRVRVRAHPLARRVMDLCASRPALSALVEATARECGSGLDEARGLVCRMVEAGLLIAEVEVPWSEPRPLRCLARQVRLAGCSVPWLESVEAIEETVDALPAVPWPERERLMNQLVDRIDGLPHHRPIQSDELVRMDASTSLSVELPRTVLPDLDRFLGWYSRFYAAIYPEEGFRMAWAKRFLGRFPADTPISALALYHGVLEPATESRKGAFPRPTESDASGQARRARFDGIRDALAARAREAVARDLEEVSLEDLDDPALLGWRDPPRYTCGVLFQVAARGPADVDAGRYRLCVNAVYPGVGLSVARLASLHDHPSRPIERELEAGWRGLERDGAVVAEVSYMHAGRTANAGLRPPLLRYEIVLPGDRPSDHARAIALADLTVTFESATGRFRLDSRALGVEVLPVVTSGISPEGFVSFLLMIGSQGYQPLGYFPGFEVKGVRRWPRFTLGRVVVWRQRWVFAAGEWPDLRDLGALAGWRRRHQLPRHVFVHTTADPKPSYTDLESPGMLGLLRHRLEAQGHDPGAGSIHVTEMLPGPDELWVRDETGRYASEFLVHRIGPGAANDFKGPPGGDSAHGATRGSPCLPVGPGARI